MPTLVTVTPDTIDLDYFYQKCPKSFGIRIHEDNINTSHPIPPNKQPSSCITTELRSAIKTSHFFKAPTTSSIVSCFCGKFHIHFISTTN